MDQVEKTPPKLFSKLDHLEAWVSHIPVRENYLSSYTAKAGIGES
jgi:hypothetical protein